MFRDLKLSGVKIFEAKIFYDERGLFYEGYNKKLFFDNGINCEFIQDNNSKSLRKNTIRGLHFQVGQYAQAKLVTCMRGSIWDVIVDLRRDSETYLMWERVYLSAENRNMLFIPKGFAHGFITLENEVEISYKVDNYYNKESERTLIYNDENINIDWGVDLENDEIILSRKDLLGKSLNELGFLK